MASLNFAQSLTTFNLVRCIFSVSWSTAMLLGANTSTCLIGENMTDTHIDRQTDRQTERQTTYAGLYILAR